MLSVPSLPLQGQTWRLLLQNEDAAGPSPDAGVFPAQVPAASVGVFARITWTIGNATHEALVDLPAGGCALTLACDSLRVAVVNESNEARRYSASVALDQAGAGWGIPRRTVGPVTAQVGNPRTYGVPTFASTVTVYDVSNVGLDCAFLDSAGVVVGGWQQVASVQPVALDVPSGAAQFRVTALAGPGVVTAVYRLSI